MSIDVERVKTLYGNGRSWHVGNLVRWQEAYYICCVDGTGHGSEDSQIRVGRSDDLENWTWQIAIGPKTIDPNLLPVGDRLLLFGVRELDAESMAGDSGFRSHQMVATTNDGEVWGPGQRCFLMNRDFWHPIAHGGRYWATCDTSGHVSRGVHNAVDLLVSDDGESWAWVSEIVHGSDGPEYRDVNGVEFGSPGPSEAALHFLDDGRLLAITRARGYCALMSTAEPPYIAWTHRLSEESRCYGAAVAQVGERVLVTGRSFANEGVRATDGLFNEPVSEHDDSGLRTGLFLYEEDDIRLQAVLPSGGDTGYAGILPLNDERALVAYYSTHEYAPGPERGSNVYLAVVKLG
ncbi:MAG: hypothetical protein VX293_11235 [Candidatus Latescibacterota bacterium]|nr:hypothetical protein [Candidatus Latescibacterota bacterium]